MTIAGIGETRPETDSGYDGLIPEGLDALAHPMIALLAFGTLLWIHNDLIIRHYQLVA